MFSKGNDTDLLTLMILLTKLANIDDSRYTEILTRILQRRLPRLNLRTGDKELDYVLEELRRDPFFLEDILQTRNRYGKSYGRQESREVAEHTAREVAEHTIYEFRSYVQKSLERTRSHFSEDLKSIESRLKSIEENQERLSFASTSANEQIEISKAEIQSYLWLLSTGADISRVELERYVPVRIYLSDPVPSPNELSNLTSALDELSEFAGLKKTGEFPSEQGSWWKQIFYRTKDTVSQEGLQRRITKVEQAIQTNYLDKPQAEANAYQAEAVSSLILALKEVPEACIQVGSLLIVKTTGADGQSMIAARTLTAQELKLLEENQPMLRCPDRILEWLNHGKNQPLLDEREVQSDSDRTPRLSGQLEDSVRGI